MAATGALSGFGGSSNYSVAGMTGSASPRSAGVTLDFPTSVLGQRPIEEAAPAEVVEEVVIVPARAAAPAPRVPAAPAAPGCVADVTAALNSITSAIPLVTTAEQGQVLLAQANAVGVVANNCLAEAKQVGFAGVDSVAQLVNQVGALAGQISALPVVAALTPEQLAQAPNPAGGVLGGVGSVVGGTLKMVGDGLGLLGTGLNLLTSPLQK